jgi:glucosamine--fructose-6-phosphate aminotransferase (isomerizing)
MATDLSIVQGNYFRDLLSQAVALKDTLEQFEGSKELHALRTRLHQGKFKTVVLTGMGSSFHGLNPLLLQLTEAGFPAVLVETSELIYYRRRLLSPDSLVVVVSQSGRSVETIRLLELNRGRSPIIAVTNTPDSPLARRGDAVVLIHAGEEFSVSCKTYVTTLAGLKFLGDQLCRIPFGQTQKQLKAALSPATHYLAAWKDHVECLISKLSGIRQLFLVGRGPSLAAVGTGALILKESTQYPTEGLSSAAFRHGPFEMLGPETFVLIFAGLSRTRELNERLLEDIRRQEGRAELIAEGNEPGTFSLPKVPPSVLPLLEILPAQMMTLALAVISGREPGRFRLATKITTTE